MSGSPVSEKSIFQSAIDKATPEERAAHLDVACGDNLELRREVEALLAAHDGLASRAAGGRQTVPDVTLDHVPAGESSGAAIGPYKLLQQIGEGGMGVVFMAEQTHPVRRKVALKLIKVGMDSRQVIARFESERQALAMMDHVNIARALDAGTTPSGSPYFVMELVHGVPISKYCDDNQLTPRQRLELFIPVCRAIQHAHQKGIIHRDIKPSNVMVTLYDGKPVPKVIDFGVAKATEQRLTERTLFTQYGTMVGTLEHMSPEQAEMSGLGIDTRSDIYSLGVLLYELLTGSTPLSRRRVRDIAYGEILRLIKEEEPPRPSTRLSDSGDALASISAQRRTEPARLAKLVRGELDWIVMKALEKDRNRRYETASAFAADVERYLTDEEVQACPPSAVYRARKFARRHKVALSTAGVVAAALLVATLVSTWQAIRARRAEAAEMQARGHADENFLLARESVVKYLGIVADDPELKQADFHPLRKKLLESALPFFQKISAQKSDNAADEENRGVTYQRLALVRSELGENEAALADYDAGGAIFVRLVGDFPAVAAYRRDLATSHNNRALALLVLGRRSEAEVAFREALAIEAKLAKDFPGVPEYRQGVARSYNNLGNTLKDLGKRGEAETNVRQALAIGEKLATDFPEVLEYRQALSAYHGSLGQLLEDLGQGPEAEVQYRLSLGIRKQLATSFPSVPGYRQVLAQSGDSLGTLLANLGKFPEAETEYRQALDIDEKLVADFPTVPAYRQDLARSRGRFGILLRRMGKRPEAEAAFHQSLAIQQKLVADFPTTPEYRRGMASDLNNLGGLQSDENRVEAETTLRQALAIYEKVAADFPAVPEYREELASSYSNLGGWLVDRGKRVEAEAELRQAVAIEEKLVADFPSVPAYAVGLGGSYCNFGNLIQTSGQAEAALNWYRKAIATLEPMVAREPREVEGRQFLCNSHDGRANALDTLGRHDEAILDWQSAVELADPRDKEETRAWLLRSRLRKSQKDKDAAACLAAAADYEATMHTDVMGLYNASCYRALCAAVLTEDLKTPAADAARLAGEQADLSMLWLSKAVAAGCKNPEQIKSDADFNALHERPDFQKLLAELDAGKDKDKK
jgi:eukaryotic-like serine/threonine-protein kinase